MTEHSVEDAVAAPTIFGRLLKRSPKWGQVSMNLHARSHDYHGTSNSSFVIRWWLRQRDHVSLGIQSPRQHRADTTFSPRKPTSCEAQFVVVAKASGCFYSGWTNREQTTPPGTAGLNFYCHLLLRNPDASDLVTRGYAGCGRLTFLFFCFFFY